MQKRSHATGQPFSEIELVQLANEGDPVAFSQLTERYYPFLQKRAGRYSNLVGVDTDDFVQEGLLALFRAVKSFDPSAGVKFRTYAFTCINNSMVSAIKKYMRNAQRQQGMQLDDMDEQNLYNQAGVLDDARPEDVFFAMETANHRARQIETLLSDFEQQVLRHYLDGRSYQEIADGLHTSTKAVDNALQRVRQKLRPKL